MTSNDYNILDRIDLDKPLSGKHIKRIQDAISGGAISKSEIKNFVMLFSNELILYCFVMAEGDINQAISLFRKTWLHFFEDINKLEAPNNCFSSLMKIADAQYELMKVDNSAIPDISSISCPIETHEYAEEDKYILRYLFCKAAKRLSPKGRLIWIEFADSLRIKDLSNKYPIKEKVSIRLSSKAGIERQDSQKLFLKVIRFLTEEVFKETFNLQDKNYDFSLQVNKLSDLLTDTEYRNKTKEKESLH